MEEWNDGKMEEWKNSTMEKWKSGRVRGWKNFPRRHGEHGDGRKCRLATADWRLFLRFALCARPSATQTSKYINNENI